MVYERRLWLAGVFGMGLVIMIDFFSFHFSKIPFPPCLLLFCFIVVDTGCVINQHHARIKMMCGGGENNVLSDSGWGTRDVMRHVPPCSQSFPQDTDCH